MELCSSASWSCHQYHHMSVFAQQRVDVCLQFRSKFNVSVLCAFAYVLLLQDCVCVCVFIWHVCVRFFFLASRLQRCRCASERKTQRETQYKGVTWKESHGLTMCHCWRPGELASNNNPLTVCVGLWACCQKNQYSQCFLCSMWLSYLGLRVKGVLCVILS